MEQYFMERLTEYVENQAGEYGMFTDDGLINFLVDRGFPRKEAEFLEKRPNFERFVLGFCASELLRQDLELLSKDKNE